MADFQEVAEPEIMEDISMIAEDKSNAGQGVRVAANGSNGALQVEQLNAYNETSDTYKIESNGQNYYDLLPTAFVVAANTQVAIGAGSNYNLSATGSWILHPLIKKAKAMQVWGNFAYNTEFKVYVSPVDAPDSNTPEYAYKGVTEQSWAFVDKTGASVVANSPAAGRIMPISANALKFYVKNADVTNPETLTVYIRLIF